MNRAFSKTILLNVLVKNVFLIKSRKQKRCLVQLTFMGGVFNSLRPVRKTIVIFDVYNAFVDKVKLPTWHRK